MQGQTIQNVLFEEVVIDALGQQISTDTKHGLWNEKFCSSFIGDTYLSKVFGDYPNCVGYHLNLKGVTHIGWIRLGTRTGGSIRNDFDDFEISICVDTKLVTSHNTKS